MALSLHNGTKIARFAQGDRKRTTQSAAVMNEFCDALDALCNPIVRSGKKPRIVLANNGIVFELPDGGAADGSGPVRYRGEYENDADPNYTSFDIVRVSPTNPFSSTQPGGTTVPGVYICIVDNPNPASDFPKHPLQIGGENSFWNWLSTWPSEVTICNQSTKLMEDWFIDGQKKPSVTADNSQITADETSVTADQT